MGKGRIFLVLGLGFASLLSTGPYVARAEIEIATLGILEGPQSISIDSTGSYGYSLASASVSTTNVSIVKYSLDPLVVVGATTERVDFVGSLVLSSDSRFGYILGNVLRISTSSGEIRKASIYKIDLATMSVVSSQEYQVALSSIAIDQTGQTIYAAGDQQILKINSSNWAVENSLTTSGDPRYVSFNRVRINPSNGDVIAILRSGTGFSYGVQQNPSELIAYHSDLSVSESLGFVGKNPIDMEISASGKFVIVTDYLDQTATRIDLNTKEKIVINLYHRYGAILGDYTVAISPSEGFVLVGGSGFIERINLDTNTRGTLTEIALGKIVFLPSGEKALALNISSNGESRKRIHLLAVNRLDQQSIENPFMPSEVRVGLGRTGLYASASSGKQVQYFSDTPSICNVAGSNLELIGIGTCTIRASQSGGQGWDAAPVVTGSMNVVRNLITFSKIGNLNLTADSTALQARTDMGSHVALRSDDPSICEIYGGKIHPLKAGRCRITAYEDQLASGIRALEVTQSVWVFPDQEVGISIGAGKNFTNSSNVNLNMVWPDGATSVRISNDGGFTSTNTRSYALDLEIPWALSGSTSSKSTRVVYARFSGPGIDGTRTYSDDIDLDVIAPSISSVQASSASGKTKLKIRATDNLSKISKLIVNSKKSALGQTVLSYASTVTIKGNKKTLWIRVQDGAGNLSAWRKI